MKPVFASFALMLTALFGVGHTGARAEAPPPLSVYGQLPGFEDATLSPSGERIAITGMVGDERRLIVIDRDNKPLLAVPLNDSKVRGIYWIGEDRVLVYKSDTANLGIGFTTGKAELYSAVVIPLNGKKPWSVFEKSKLITGGVRNFYGVSQHGGKWYGYFGGITRDFDGKTEPRLVSTKPVLYEVDLDTGSPRKIAARSDDGVYRSWTITPEGTVGATLDYVSQSGSWYIRNSRGQKIATGISKTGDVSLVGLGSVDNTLIYAVADEEGESRWIEVPLAGGEAKEVLADISVERSFFDQRSRRFMGYALAGDMPTYRFLDARRQKIVDATLKAFPGNAVTLIDWNNAFDRLIVTTEGGEDPQRWWLVDIKTGDARPLGQSYLVQPAHVGPVKMIRYKAGDGAEIAAVLTLPPGRAAKNLPVLLFPHGGPAAHDTLGFNWWAQAFA
ncbi:MAG TPA: S9 family peptidase, partial [Sphingobium sp.]|nr:S9 family peptidase [Sphingobium sp.]